MNDDQMNVLVQENVRQMIIAGIMMRHRRNVEHSQMMMIKLRLKKGQRPINDIQVIVNVGQPMMIAERLMMTDDR